MSSSQIPKPSYTSNALHDIVIGNLVPGQRDKIMAQALLYLCDKAEGTTTVKAQVDAASDMVQVINYLDAGDSTNRRIGTVVTASGSLGLSYTDTFSYGGSAGDYYLTGVTRS